MASEILSRNREPDFCHTVTNKAGQDEEKIDRCRGSRNGESGQCKTTLQDRAGGVVVTGSEDTYANILKEHDGKDSIRCESCRASSKEHYDRSHEQQQAKVGRAVVERTYFRDIGIEGQEADG